MNTFVLSENKKNPTYLVILLPDFCIKTFPRTNLTSSCTISECYTGWEPLNMSPIGNKFDKIKKFQGCYLTDNIFVLLLRFHNNNITGLWLFGDARDLFGLKPILWKHFFGEGSVDNLNISKEF